MSDREQQPSTTTVPPPRPHPAITALMIVGGIILLLPGLCSLFFILALLGEDFRSLVEPSLIALWVVCFAVSVGGILLIRRTVRRRREIAQGGA